MAVLGARLTMFAGNSKVLRKPHARPNAYATPCGRYSVERTGAARFDVYGPAGFVEWFVTLADAKILTDELSEKTSQSIRQLPGISDYAIL
jgi:hypothetical protein